MFMYRPIAPSYLLMKRDPEEYQRQWKRYALAESNYQTRLIDMECDMMALRDMHLMYHNNPMAIPCPGCTLGGGFGIFM